MMDNLIFKFFNWVAPHPLWGAVKNIHPTYFEAGFENKK